MSTNDTIVALSSAPGTAGVAVLRLSGPDAWAAALAIFTPVRGGALRAGRVRLGTVQDAKGEVLDRCLLLPFKGPESYTGEDVAEF
ncbi:MAG: tRNA uridine-5-carboxymethylaminomethyl(34) synthesis GTPase MnmE, partial [Candidatus Cloacimonetes bacterium]|nr:tRNA uridine-5-carboxymethylaminomethyl(34) synthesis GTPase MnmE [Candidatus Cloacimonadota bacterium]